MSLIDARQPHVPHHAGAVGSANPAAERGHAFVMLREGGSATGQEIIAFARDARRAASPS